MVTADMEGGSAGHELGQVVGNWYEEYIAWPVLEGVANRLGLYCDTRFKNRACRGSKLIWADADGNEVDYDFVLELGGTDQCRGVPVAFFETFWRRGSRHSKDKARDDSGKLLGMRDAYPTARHLGIVAAGDFTAPAQVLVRSRGIDLFYTSKDRILSSWLHHGVLIDYPDKLAEDKKRLIVEGAVAMKDRDPGLLKRIAETVFEKIGPAELDAFESRVAGKIGATPQMYVVCVVDSTAREFDSREQVDVFLNGMEPGVMGDSGDRSYAYNVVFGDGDSFQRDDLDWRELKALHSSLDALVLHMAKRSRSSRTGTARKH